MSKLSDIKLLNKSISQGSIYQINKKNTLGSFTTLEGVSKEPSHTSIESFLPNGSHTDENDARFQDSGGNDARYEDLSLNELYEIYSGKIASLDQELKDFEPLAATTPPAPGDSSNEYQLYKATNTSGTHYFTNDGTTYSAIPYFNTTLTPTTNTSPTDWTQDSTLSDTTTTDQVLLTCNNMPTTDHDSNSSGLSGSNLITAAIDQATDAEIKAGICNPYTDGTDAGNYQDIINLIAQLNEIAEQMKIKMEAAGEESDTSIGMIADVTENLDYYTSRFEYMLKYKVRFSDITDVDTPPSSITDNSSGYLEIEGLKFESAQLLYMSLLLGTLVAGAVTVGAIIKSNKQ
jgi:hypothetical protein